MNEGVYKKGDPDLEQEIQRTTKLVATKPLNLKYEDYIKRLSKLGDKDRIKYLLENTIYQIIVNQAKKNTATWEISKMIEESLMYRRQADKDEDLTEEKQIVDKYNKNPKKFIEELNQ